MERQDRRDGSVANRRGHSHYTEGRNLIASFGLAHSHARCSATPLVITLAESPHAQPFRKASGDDTLIQLPCLPTPPPPSPTPWGLQDLLRGTRDASNSEVRQRPKASPSPPVAPKPPPIRCQHRRTVRTEARARQPTTKICRRGADRPLSLHPDRGIRTHEFCALG